MIETWIADIRYLKNRDCFEKHYSSLPKWRKEKADQLKTPLKKAQSVGAWILWQEIQRKYQSEESEVLGTFNLSHAGDYVMCSVDRSKQVGIQIGCDIEKVKPVNLSVAKRFFCPAEYDRIMAEDTRDKKTETFYRFWVLKESFVKATKKGFRIDPRSFEIVLTTPPTLLRQPKEFTSKYYYQEYEWNEIPYKMAVCATTPIIAQEINREFIDVLKTIC